MRVKCMSGQTRKRTIKRTKNIKAI